MQNKRLDFIFILFAMVVGLAVAALFMTGCIPGEAESTRLIDGQGNVIYSPPGPVLYERKIPSTGRPAVDYAVGGIATALYAAFVYYVRRVKVNGAKDLTETNKRIDELAKKIPGSPLVPPSPMTADEVRELRLLLLPKPE